jgi:hypothetical protein
VSGRVIGSQVCLGLDNATGHERAIIFAPHQQLAEELPRDDTRMAVKENARHQFACCSMTIEFQR